MEILALPIWRPSQGLRTSTWTEGWSRGLGYPTPGGSLEPALIHFINLLCSNPSSHAKQGDSLSHFLLSIPEDLYSKLTLIY